MGWAAPSGAAHFFPMKTLLVIGFSLLLTQPAAAAYTGGEVAYDVAQKVWNITPVGGTLTQIPTASVATAANANTFRNVVSVGATVGRIAVPLIGAAAGAYYLYNQLSEPETPEGWTSWDDDGQPAEQPATTVTTLRTYVDSMYGGCNKYYYATSASDLAVQIKDCWNSTAPAAQKPATTTVLQGQFYAGGVPIVRINWSGGSQNVGYYSWTAHSTSQECPANYTLNGSTCYLDPEYNPQWPADNTVSVKNNAGSYEGYLYDPDPYVEPPEFWITTNANGHPVVTYVEPMPDGGQKWTRHSEAQAQDGTTWTVSESFQTDANGEVVSSSATQSPGTLSDTGKDPAAATDPISVQLDTTGLAQEATLAELVADQAALYEGPENLANVESEAQTLFDAIAGGTNSLEDELTAYGDGLPAGFADPVEWPWSISTGAACQGLDYDFYGVVSGTFDAHCSWWDNTLEPAVGWFFVLLTAMYVIAVFYSATGYGR